MGMITESDAVSALMVIKPSDGEQSIMMKSNSSRMGSMALDMKKYGKIKFVYDKRCRVITGYGGLKEKSILAAMWHRLKFYGVTRLFSKTDHYEDAPDNFLKKK